MISSDRMRRAAESIPGLVLIASLLTTVVFLTTPVTESNRGFDFDGVFYAAMAGSPLINNSYAHVAPWCYRILTPAVVHLLPWDTLTSFRASAFASNIAALCLLFAILRRLRFAPGSCWLGLVLYLGVFWTAKFSFYSPAYIDNQTELFLLGIIYLTITSQYVLLTAILMLGAIQKESLAVFAVFAVAHLIREKGRRPDFRTGALSAALIGLPLAAVAIVRAIVPAPDEYSAAQATLAELRHLGDWHTWPVMAQSMFSGLGLLPVLLVASPRVWLTFLRAHFEWAVYLAIAVALLFGGVDKARLLLYALPLVVILSLCVVDAMRGATSAKLFAAWTGVLLALHLFIGGHLTPMGAYGDYLARMVPEHAGDRYLPYLARNGMIAALFGALTLGLGISSSRRGDSL